MKERVAWILDGKRWGELFGRSKKILERKEKYNGAFRKERKKLYFDPPKCGQISGKKPHFVSLTGYYNFTPAAFFNKTGLKSILSYQTLLKLQN